MAVIDLIESIRRFLTASESPFAQPVLKKMNGISITQGELCPQEPCLPGHMKPFLDQALQRADQKDLEEIVSLIISNYRSLNWRVDDGLYYDKNANVGEGYANNNMHCELIGPRNSFFTSPDFTLGIFVLGSHVFYRDHCHTAPEFYLNMTGPTQWRFDKQKWETFEAGSMLWNPSDRIHATRVGETPFLSIYSWVHSIAESCQVVDVDDWEQYESTH